MQQEDMMNCAFREFARQAMRGDAPFGESDMQRAFRAGYLAARREPVPFVEDMQRARAVEHEITRESRVRKLAETFAEVRRCAPPAPALRGALAAAVTWMRNFSRRQGYEHIGLAVTNKVRCIMCGEQIPSVESPHGEHCPITRCEAALRASEERA